MAVYRSDQFAVTLTVLGLPEGKQTDNVAWDSLEGGENTVEGQTYLPGGMKPAVSVGGIPKRNPATLKRIWSDSLLSIYKALDQAAGQAAIELKVATLNTKREVVPGAVVLSYTGTLGTVTRPNYGSELAEKAFLAVMLDLDTELA